MINNIKQRKEYSNKTLQSHVKLISKQITVLIPDKANERFKQTSGI